MLTAYNEVFIMTLWIVFCTVEIVLWLGILAGCLWLVVLYIYDAGARSARQSAEFYATQNKNVEEDKREKP